MAKRTGKSRVKTSKSAGRRKPSSAKAAVRVRDAAVPAPGPHRPNTSAFKPIRKAPPSLESLSAPSRKRLVDKLIPRPEPPPTARLVKFVKALEPPLKRFHGMKVPLYWFPPGLIHSPCADKFGYMFSAAVRNSSKLPFNATTEALLALLGGMMGDPGRGDDDNPPTPPGVPDSTIPAGYTYFGQFVDHDITLDVSSSLDNVQDANTITNMRTPALDLDSVYGRGPALDPFLYRFPSGGDGLPPTAVKLQIGRNQPSGPGGPLTAGAATAIPVTFDVPRVLSGTQTVVTAPDSTFTAIIGDPRNDENLIVSQLHHAMLRFHNRVGDLLVTAFFSGDIFAEAKKIVTHHYQWCVVHDFLARVCGTATVNNAIASPPPPPGPFRMPVEFAVAAYRFGHSMIRDRYLLNSSLPVTISSLDNVFAFIRVPLLPVLSNWVVDFNMFFHTAHPIPGSFNNARKIDSVLANGLERIPGGSGILAILAARNLRRGMAMELPSGQGAAAALGIPPLTTAQLTAGLPAAEVALLNSNGGILLSRTPLWYYVLREAVVLNGGDQLGPVGGRIVAETFVRMLRRDANSFMNVSGFTPSLPSSVPGTFMIADMLDFAGVLVQ
jgi:hypothetical protein